ncbi:MAG: hypothetical protein ACPGYZ_09905, partial [Flavobacteriales bacterium]
ALLARFRNVGSATAPAFAQLDTNWLALPDLGVESVAPTFGDLDGDGDDELILGDELGNLHLWTDTSAAGEPALYDLTEASMADAEGVAIDVGQFAVPCLHDLDGDGDLDLLVGEKNGVVHLYENTGSAASAAFTLFSPNAGGVTVDNVLGINGFPTPSVLVTDTGSALVVGNELGHLQVFALPENPLAAADAIWPEISNQWDGVYEGEFAAPALADLDGDGAQDLVLGTRNGGLTLWRSGAEDAVRGCAPLVDGLPELRPDDVASAWTPFPNPVAPGGSLAVPTARLALWDLLGREVAVLEARHGQVILPAGLAHGTYLAQPQGPETATGAPWLGSARRIVVGPVR